MVHKRLSGGRNVTRLFLRFCILSAVLCLIALPAAEASQDAAEESRARLLGALTGTKLTVRFDEAPAREAIGSLSKALAIPIIGRFSDDRIGHGIDPEAPITFTLEEASGLFVLEMILEQATEYEPITWQLRHGFVEVGTKERLSAPAACESRSYNVRDLMLEPPYFVSPGERMPSVADFDEHPYATAVLSRPDPDGRKRPEVLVLEIIRGIIETIEPGNWDFGQYDNDGEDEISTPPEGPGAESTRSPPPRRHRRPLKIATIRLWRDTIIIRAPDYIHRQVNGNPDPIPPAPLTDRQREERAQRASTGRAHIIVLTTAAPAAPDAAPRRSHLRPPGVEGREAPR